MAAMSWFMAAIYDLMMKDTEEECLAAWRARLLSDIEGTVLEIGAGTGVNFEHYPPSVSRLIVTEPDEHMRRRLERKHGHRFGQKVEFQDAPAEALPLEDGAVDAVVSTLVLCSVGDPRRAIGEIHRVLAPGGRFTFLEHVAADPHSHPSRRKWQGRVEPVWKHLAGNCHLTRETESYIRDAGFELQWVEHESMRKAPPWVRPTVRGMAVKAAS